TSPYAIVQFRYRWNFSFACSIDLNEFQTESNAADIRLYRTKDSYPTTSGNACAIDLLTGPPIATTTMSTRDLAASVPTINPFCSPPVKREYKRSMVVAKPQSRKPAPSTTIEIPIPT